VLGRTAQAVADARLTSWRVEIDRFRIKDDPDTGIAIPIWPEKCGSDYLEERKARMGADYDFVYRLEATSERRKLVRRLAWYDSNDAALREKLLYSERWLSIDPAASTGSHGSDTGIVEVVITSEGYVYFTDVWTLHCEIGGVLDWLVNPSDKSGRLLHHPGIPYRGIQWEVQGAVKVGFGLVATDIQRRLEEAGYEYPLNIIQEGTRVGGKSQNRGKHVRLRECASFFENGMVRLAGVQKVNRWLAEDDPRRVSYGPKENSRMELFGQTLLDFDPTGKTDAVDAGTQWILHNRERIKNPEVKLPPVENTQQAEPEGVGGRFAKDINDYFDKLFNPDESTLGQEHDFIGKWAN